MALQRVQPFIIDTATNFTFNSATITANIVAGNANLGNLTSSNYFSGNGSLLSSITASNITGQVGNALIAGTVYTASQPNITSIGTLTSLSVTGNISAGNIAGGNLVNANYISGNGSLLSSITGGNVSGQVGNALVAGTVYTASQPNITSVGTLSSLTVTGNITAGNVNAGNLLTANYTNAVLTTASQPNITSVGTLTSLSVTGNITSGNANLGNLTTSNYFTGNGSLLTSITGGNVTGQVGNALISGTVYTAAQPNITSVGTLTSLAVTGNITSGNANLGNNVTSNYFTGSGQYLTSVTAVTAATVTTAAQPNITSVGTLTTVTIGNSTSNITMNSSSITSNVNVNLTGSNISLGAIGNIKITGGTAGYFITTDGAGNLSWGAAAGGGGVSASGSNTQIQFNDGGVLGAVANLTFNKSTNTLTVDKAIHINGANLGSNVSNVYIGGGGVSQILATDGSGNLTWVAQPTATITVDNFTGDGTTTAFTLSTTPASINQTVVNYNGIFQLRTSAYTLTGPTITFSEAPANGSKIEVTTTMGATSGAGAFVTRTYTGTGAQTTFTVTYGTTVSSVLVTENGLLQTPTTDYTISGSTLTFVTAPGNGVTIQIRELAIAIATTTSPAYRQYTGNGVANTFTITSGLTANSLIVAENGILQRPTVDYSISGSNVVFVTAPASGVDIQIRELSLNGGMSTGGISLPYQGGNSGKYLTTDGATASWSTVSTGSNLAIQLQGTNVATTANTINFSGGGDSVTASGNVVTVNQLSPFLLMGA